MFNKHGFGDLFRKFRLRAQFKTLTMLGDSLQQHGFFQEDSTFSRWENGSRIPRNRNLLIGIVNLFVSHGGIENIDEANKFLETAGQGFLTKAEESDIWKNRISEKPFQAPREITYFTGRREYLKRVLDKLKKGKVVLIYGLPGSGKTSLAIKIAHQLREEFSDGVLWLRLDTSSTLESLVNIADSFGEDISQIHNPHTAASFIRSLLTNKKVLLIYDSAITPRDLNLLIPNSANNAVLITSQYEDYESSYIADTIKLGAFDKHESLTLFKKILKSKYDSFSEKDLLQISELFNSLPLAIDIIAHRLIDPQANLETIIKEVEKEKIELSSYKYENKDLFIAVSFIFKSLNSKEQNFLLSLGILKGKDFSQDVIASINNLDIKTTSAYISKIIHHSLLEYSTAGRYRLHPVIKYFIHSKRINLIYYKRALEFYYNFLAKNKEKANYFSLIQPDVYSINGIIEYYLAKNSTPPRLFDLLIETNNFLWYKGYWDNYKKINEKLYGYSISKNKSYMRLLSCTNLGKVYYWIGKLTKSKKFTEEAIQISKSSKNEKFLAENRDRLGKIYQFEGDFKKADRYLNLSLKYFEDKKEFEKKGNVLRHIAEGYMFKKNFELAIRYLNLALKEYLLIEDYTINYMYQSLISSHFATNFYMMKDYRKAEKLFIQSLMHERKAGGRAGTKIGSLLGLALIYKKRKSSKCNNYLKRAKKEIEILGINQNIAKLVVSYYVLRNELSKNEISII